MKIDAWHQRQLKSDPEYAKAAEFLDAVQDLADVIVGLRIRAGLSQSRLAAQAGVTQAAISQLEHGARNPTLATLARVLKALLEAPTPAVQPKYEYRLAHTVFTKTFAPDPSLGVGTVRMPEVHSAQVANGSRQGAAPRLLGHAFGVA